MKVLHLSTADANGGAARGAYAMHKALCSAGVDSRMLVAEKYTDDSTVIGPKDITGFQKVLKGVRQTIEYQPLKQYKNKQPGAFSPAIYASKVVEKVEAIDPDIINLHWVAGGMLRPQDLAKFQRQRSRPLVWTMRDMWPFTGGCHYSGSCSAYKTSCGQCPILGSDEIHDLAYRGWHRKQTAWKNLEITLAPLSTWLAECARSSRLFAHQTIQVIPNAIDAEAYRPIDKAIARDLLNLPQPQKIIIFGSLSPTADPRKGFKYLRAALQHLATQANAEQLEVVIFGTDQPAQDLDLRLPTTFLGRLHDDTMLAIAYSAADVMVMPSIQDNFAKTAIEAMACGTPVVGFNGTGFKDCVVHQNNGYAATCFDAVDLAKGIDWVLADSDRWQTLSANARKTVEDNFTVVRQAEQYQQLYTRLLHTSKTSQNAVAPSKLAPSSLGRGL